MVVKPIVSIILQGEWHTIMLLDSWERVSGQLDWPPQRLQDAEEVDANAELEGIATLPDAIRQSASTIREASSAFLASLPASEKPGRERQLSTLAASLDKWEATFDPHWEYETGSGTDSNDKGDGPTQQLKAIKRGRGGERNSAYRMLQLALISLATRQSGHAFKDLIGHVLEVVWPGSTRGLTAAAGSASNHLLNYAVLLIDMGYACLQQDTLSDESDESNDFVFFWKFDSSPQGNYDWLISSYIMVAKSALATLFVAISTLALNAASLSSEEVCNLTRTIVDGIKKHVQLPMALARGCSNITHKIAALLHALWMETGSLRVMRRVFANSISATTDMGTEFGAADFRVDDYYSLLPSWLSHTDVSATAAAGSSAFELEPDGGHSLMDAAENAIDGLEPDIGIAMPPPTESEPRLADFLFGRCYRMMGMIHLIHNAMSESKDGFTHWKRFEKMLQQVCKIFTIVSLRDQFIRTCCVGPFAWLSSVMATQAPKYINWRWGSLGKTLKSLLKYGGAVRRAWRMNRQQARAAFDPAGAHERDRNDNDDERLDPRLLEECFENAWFWVFAVMLDIHVDTPSKQIAYVESCPCHGMLLSGAKSESIKQAMFHRMLLHKNVATSVEEAERYKEEWCCPCTGMMFPEVVHNGLQEFTQVTKQNNVAEIIANAQEFEPSQNDVDSVLEDYGKGHDLMISVLDLKLACLLQFPYILGGLAHPDTNKAKNLAIALMQRFDADPRPEIHHRITVFWLQFEFPNGLRVFLVRWAVENVSLELLPVLAMELAALR